MDVRRKGQASSWGRRKRTGIILDGAGLSSSEGKGQASSLEKRTGIILDGAGLRK